MTTQLSQRQLGLFDLWQARKGARRFPARRDFDVLELKAWLGDLHLLEVERGGADFRYRVFSTNFAIRLGYDLTGKLISETLEPNLRAVGLACYGEVCRSGRPYLIRRPTVIAGALPYQTMRHYLALPLGESDAAVDRILALHDQLLQERMTSNVVEFIPLDGGPAHSRPIEEFLVGGEPFAGGPLP